MGDRSKTIWIYTKTMLIDQIETRIDAPGRGTMTDLQTITKSVKNPTIPSNSFTEPT